MKKVFETTLTWKTTGEEFIATIKVMNSGWGEVYDQDGYYCGSLNPMRTRELAGKAKEA